MSAHTTLIVLAEDNPADVLLVRTALEEEGLTFDLRPIADGEEVLRMLDEVDGDGGQQRPPDLFILDLNLPKYSGQDILQRMRKSPHCCNAPVIVMTSSDSPKDRQNAARSGVTEYFRKPTDLEEFLSLGKIVRRALDRAVADKSLRGD